MSKLLSAVFAKNNKVQKIDEFVAADKQIHTMSLLVQSRAGKTLIDTQKGGLGPGKPFILASISKLYTYSIVYALIDEKKISYDDTLSRFFSEETLSGLSTFGDKEYAPHVTIRQLLDQTSGFGDYETDKQSDGSTVMKDILSQDLSVDFAKSLELTRQVGPRFRPGTKNRSHYANINANLLGEIASQVTGKTYENLLERFIVNKLQLKETFPCTPKTKHEAVYAGSSALVRPKYLSSSVSSGGILSTNHELMTFIRGFFEGRLFETKHIEHPSFRRIQFFPIKYGSGMMQVQMSRAMSPLFPAPELIGHSGSSGSFAYYCPLKDVYVTGTINQLKVRPFPIMYLYLNAI